jgi:hypothetical protein
MENNNFEFTQHVPNVLLAANAEKVVGNLLPHVDSRFHLPSNAEDARTRESGFFNCSCKCTIESNPRPKLEKLQFKTYETLDVSYPQDRRQTKISPNWSITKKDLVLPIGFAWAIIPVVILSADIVHHGRQPPA